ENVFQAHSVPLSIERLLLADRGGADVSPMIRAACNQLRVMRGFLDALGGALAAVGSATMPLRNASACAMAGLPTLSTPARPKVSSSNRKACWARPWRDHRLARLNAARCSHALAPCSQ